MIYFDKSACNDCQDAIARAQATKPEQASGQPVDLDFIEELITTTQKARTYLDTHNSHSDLPAAQSVFIIDAANELLVAPADEQLAAFGEFLSKTAAAAYALGVPDIDPAQREGVWNPDNRIPATCTACRGQCCGPGLDEHAFLCEQSVRAPLIQDPDLDAKGIEDFYLGYLPEKHVAGSCLYHAETGCALPRWSRGDLCGSYLCGTLIEFLRETNGVCDRHVHLVVADAQTGPKGAINSHELQVVGSEKLQQA